MWLLISTQQSNNRDQREDAGGVSGDILYGQQQDSTPVYAEINPQLIYDDIVDVASDAAFQFNTNIRDYQFDKTVHTQQWTR